MTEAGAEGQLNEYYKGRQPRELRRSLPPVAFFIFKYGRIDWLESNNEYWLQRDAALRTDFPHHLRFQTEDSPRIKYKSKMKEYYRKAGIATSPATTWWTISTAARRSSSRWDTLWWSSPTTAWRFRYPQASNDEAELKTFLAYQGREITRTSPYIMEEFVHARGQQLRRHHRRLRNPIFEAGNVSPHVHHGHRERQRQLHLLHHPRTCPRTPAPLQARPPPQEPFSSLPTAVRQELSASRAASSTSMFFRMTRRQAAWAR